LPTTDLLVIAPHPDDEVLGCGGTIRRCVADGQRVAIAIATKGTPLFPSAQVRRVRSEARKAAAILGADEPIFLDLPVTTLHLIPEHDLNATFARLIQRTRPSTVFLPFPGDRHEDHRQVFDAAMVALRTDGRRHAVRRVLCYETVSETHWSAPGIESAFEPQHFVEISATLEHKLAAMRAYASQLKDGIPARALTAIEALARFRGSVVGWPAAEAFQVVRELWPAAAPPGQPPGTRKREA
jgi:LmbE family N-acetylglucosaminyl deacetylase